MVDPDELTQDTPTDEDADESTNHEVVPSVVTPVELADSNG